MLGRDANDPHRQVLVAIAQGEVDQQRVRAGSVNSSAAAKTKDRNNSRSSSAASMRAARTTSMPSNLTRSAAVGTGSRPMTSWLTPALAAASWP